MTTSTDTTVRDAAQQAFQSHLDLLSAGRIPEWVELFTDDGVLEFPYGPEGFPKAVTGKTELYDYMRNFPEHFAVEFSAPVFHLTVDPTLVIAEFSSTGHAITTGRPYNQRYISVVETVDGRIRRYVDFWNPQTAADAVRGGVDGVFATIEATSTADA
ncbi:nuclear transport factor 2 family protein [Microbacterium ureisolvens]|uniref:Nuclear transport factor 2 family protein n=1 Tax=Microbacterium ureisolvens TaxID=2781186 RepID=A0ABS7I233_9MICO|nr:nuclear transport factor 2 family protein [Microbacterium ureisolvens]MBW9110669.1 nuclear transport factor 2 family protein [Microbacterium ureisolvens]